MRVGSSARADASQAPHFVIASAICPGWRQNLIVFQMVITAFHAMPGASCCAHLTDSTPGEHAKDFGGTIHATRNLRGLTKGFMEAKIRQLAESAGFGFNSLGSTYSSGKLVEVFAFLVAAHEREECARLLEDFQRFGDTRDCVAAIRARGDK